MIVKSQLINNLLQNISYFNDKKSVLIFLIKIVVDACSWYLYALETVYVVVVVFVDVVVIFVVLVVVVVILVLLIGAVVLFS